MTKRAKQVGTAGIRHQRHSKAATSVTGPAAAGGKQWLLSCINVCVGILLCYIASIYVSSHAYTLHENNLWFSNIQEVEREISFRTECGFYYSFYKELLLAPTWTEGIYYLIHDNKTEHLREINTLYRFNIYQEVILAGIYKLQNLKTLVLPVYFYINSIFALNGMCIASLYLTTWLLSNSWLAGLLSSLFYIFNWNDATRVHFSIPLRENFSIPFFFLQGLIITYYLKSSLNGLARKLSLLAIFCCTFCFVLTWQFAQFVLLLQGVALFTLTSINIISTEKVQPLHVIQIVSLLLASFFQFFNEMLLGSLALSFAVIYLIADYFHGKHQGGNVFLPSLTLLMIRGCTTVVAAFSLNYFIKIMLNVEADEHIFKFVQRKLGRSDQMSRDFDTNMYLCNHAFHPLPLYKYVSLTKGLVLPCYLLVMVTGITLLFIFLIKLFRTDRQNIMKNEKADSKLKTESLNNHLVEDRLINDNLFVTRPEIAYHIVISIPLAVLAITTMRFKYLWTPHMCIIAAWGIGYENAWISLAKKFSEVPHSYYIFLWKHFVIASIIAALLGLRLPSHLDGLKTLTEFYDPDTVDLMNWIKSNTTPDSSFAGSMQLLAGVKLCTGRSITNHPHYEEKWLRERTVQVYQIYSRRPPKEVHHILKTVGAKYILIENSICFSRNTAGCKLTDIVDMHNGHLYHGATGDVSDLVYVGTPRFCDALLTDPDYLRHFKLVFTNKTFRVYKVI